MQPGFSHLQEVPAIERPSGIVQVFAGELAEAASPAPYFSALLGADVQVHPRSKLTLPLNPDYEHALLVMSGDVALDGQRLEQRMLYYLGTTRSDACFSSEDGGRILLIGGPPFPERILMWWNFVARTPDEITQARADWEERRRFGEVHAYAGPRLTAPALTRFARPNPVS
jgi:redox-sensitive bicupin YhaK (pirin superfamily)